MTEVQIAPNVELGMALWQGDFEGRCAERLAAQLRTLHVEPADELPLSILHTAHLQSTVANI